MQLSESICNSLHFSTFDHFHHYGKSIFLNAFDSKIRRSNNHIPPITLQLYYLGRVQCTKMSRISDLSSRGIRRDVTGI